MGVHVHVCVHVCVHLCVCVRVHMCVHVCERELELDMSAFICMLGGGGGGRREGNWENTVNRNCCFMSLTEAVSVNLCRCKHVQTHTQV